MGVEVGFGQLAGVQGGAQAGEAAGMVGRDEQVVAGREGAEFDVGFVVQGAMLKSRR